MSDTATYDPRGVTGFTHEELAEAFDRVRDPRDWRGPIRAEIPAEMRPLVARAVVWFTATAPAFAPTERDDLLLATAPGYQRGPWGRPDRVLETGHGKSFDPSARSGEGVLLPHGLPGGHAGGESAGTAVEPDDTWELRGPAFGR